MSDANHSGFMGSGNSTGRIWRRKWAFRMGTKWRSEDWLERRGGGDGGLQGSWQGKLPPKRRGFLAWEAQRWDLEGDSLRRLPCKVTIQGLQGLRRPLTHPVSPLPRPRGGSSWRPEEELPSHPLPLAHARECRGHRTWLHAQGIDTHSTTGMPVT